MRAFLHRQNVSEASIINAHLPWMGDPPLVIAFRDQGLCDALYAMVQVGRCTSHSTNGEESGSLWVNFQGSPSRWEHADYRHQCPEDHLLNWPNLKRRFVLEFHADTAPMGDRIAKWLLDIAFTLSETRGALIMTHIDLDYRFLLKSFGYRDIDEEEEKNMLETEITNQPPSHATLGSNLHPAITGNFDSEEIGSVHAIQQSTVESSYNPPPCCGIPLHPFLCACSMKSFAAPLSALPFSISEFIQFGTLLSSNTDSSSTYDPRLFMYPTGTLSWSFLICSCRRFPMLLP